MSHDSWKKLSNAERLDRYRIAYESGAVTAREMAAALDVHDSAIKAVFNANQHILRDMPLRVQSWHSGTKGFEPVRSMVPESGFVCLPVTMLDLDTRGCRWPVNDDNPVMFCNKRQDPTSARPYCGYHSKLSFGLGTPSERQALEGLRI